MTKAQRLETTSSETDVLRLIGLLEVEYGQRNLSRQQSIMFVANWHLELAKFDPVTLIEAGRAHIRKGKRFPQLSEILEHCKAERQDLCEIVGRPRRIIPEMEEEKRTWRPPTAEEREAVGAMVEETLKALGFPRPAKMPEPS